jgi:small subunit ribosomal protein S17e
MARRTQQFRETTRLNIYLGKVRPEKVKKIARELVKRHTDQFTTDFEKNKRALDSMATIYSSKLRNLIAGYITRLVVISKATEAGQSAEGSGEETEEAGEND